MITRFFRSVVDFILWFLQLILRLAVAGAVAVLVFIVTQQFQIFPAISKSLLERSVRTPEKTPANISSTFLNTPDGKKIEVWALKAERPAAEPQHVALILHGGDGVIDEYLPYQRWFSSNGITSYLVEYRGMGKSTGWLSEEGMYTDAETALRFALAQEEIVSKNVIVVGISLGSAPAAYIAKRFQVGTLMLFSPVTSLPDLLQTREIQRYLVPFLWQRLPTQEYLKQTPACVVMAHGRKDTIIPFTQFEKLEANYSGAGPLHVVISDEAGHSDLLNREREALSKNLRLCL